MSPVIRYKRINLDVDVRFKSNGTLIPRQVTYKARHYAVSRVLGQRPFIPREVRCKEPIEYTTIIDGKEKKPYSGSTERKIDSINSMGSGANPRIYLRSPVYLMELKIAGIISLKASRS